MNVSEAAPNVTRSLSDADFLRPGVQRVLKLSASGRAFLQEHGVRFEHTPGHSNGFATDGRWHQAATRAGTSAPFTSAAASKQTGLCMDECAGSGRAQPRGITA